MAMPEPSKCADRLRAAAGVAGPVDIAERRCTEPVGETKGIGDDLAEKTDVG